jgi:hypothetical protein
MSSSIKNARNVLAVSFFMRSKLFESRRAQGRLELWEKANFVVAAGACAELAEWVSGGRIDAWLSRSR